MKKKTALQMVAWLLSLMMVFTMAPSIAFAAGDGERGVPDDSGTVEDIVSDEASDVADGADAPPIQVKGTKDGDPEQGDPEPEEPENHAPVLKDGVDSSASGRVLKKEIYLLPELQAGKIFVDPDGDTLNYKKNIFYQRSVDNGETWGVTQDFDSDTYMTTIGLTENTAGTYVYRFWAKDDKGASSADNNIFWTLTLEVVDEAIWDTSFYVGRDMNYASNGNKYPVIELFKTAGVNNNKNSDQYNFDYVGTFNKGGETVFVYDPADYIITGDAESGWKIQESADGPEYSLNNFEPVEFTDSTFGEDPESGTKSGNIVDNYNMFYATIPNGWYSYRGYGYSAETNDYTVKLGGMKLKIPTDSNVDGNAGGGTDIFLRTNTIYTTSKKTDNTFFTADEYHAAVVCPIMECNPQPGTPYKSGNYAYYPFLLYAGGNSCLYNNYVYPDIEGYIFTQSINATIPAGYNVNTKSMTINSAIKLNVTVPEDAEFGVYFQYNNFNSGKIEPVAEPVINNNGTKTLSYNISKGNGNYTWRLEDPSGHYVTKAGYLSSISAETDLAFTFDEDDPTAKKSHDFSKLGTQTSKRDEADIQVGLDPTGYQAMDKDAVKRVRAYRHWEIINSDSGNIMIEPDFNWSLLSGSADIDTVDGGNASANWADIDPDGTAIIAINYDSIDVFMDNAATEHSSHGGLFPATSTNRTGVIVMSDTEAGKAVAHIKYNTDGTDQTRPVEWDYNYDTWYYTTVDENPTLDFTVTGDELSKVQYALVTSGKTLKSKMTSWKSITPDDSGKYQVDLNGFRQANANGGTIIIKMTDSTGTSYCLARVAEVETFAENTSKPGEAIEPGDQVTLTFDGLYRALNKQSGIFNPTTFVSRYSAGKEEVSGTVGQYQAMDTTKITLTVPEDIEFPEGENETSYTFTNGYVFGQMFSAANPFRFVYEMTDTGVGTNFNAVTVKLCFQRLADVSVKVVKHATAGLKVQFTDGENPLDGVALTLKDSAGTVIDAADGKYEGLSFGTYSYTAEKDGFLKATGKIKLSRTDELDEDGCVTKTIEMKAIGEGEWDGESTAEPAKDADGVYQIGTPEELAWFANAVNDGSGAAFNAKLTEDIDLSGRDWTPIGISSSKFFKGSFDGSGHTVKNLFIDVTADTQAGVQYKGLFGYVKGTSKTARATIKDLKVGGSVHAASPARVNNGYIGGVFGYVNFADVENIISNVDVSIDRTDGDWMYVGGVCGYATASSLSKCLNAGDVSGQNDIGGITGFFGNEVMDQCANYGNISSGGNYAAGIAGIVSSNKNNPATMTNCYNMGSVSSPGNYVSGIAGNYGVYSVAANMYNAGTVTAKGNYTGVIAGNVQNYCNITNVFALEADGLPLFGAKGATEVVAEGEFINGRELSSAKFLKKLNGEGNAFAAGDNNPVLEWFSDWAAEQECAHKLKKHQAVSATCTSDGNVEYWSCSLCGKCFSDANADTEILETEAIVKAHGLKKIEAAEPTCTEDGHNAYYKCKNKECGKLYKDAEGKDETTLEAETIKAAGHIMKKTDDVPATFDTAGVVSWTCETCGEMFADEAGTKAINSPAAVPQIGEVTLEYTTVKYDGKDKQPAVTVTDVNGNTVDTVNYAVSYDDNCKDVGEHHATVDFRNNYSGTATYTYNITPMKTTVKLKYAKAQYNGKVKHPAVIVKDENGAAVKKTDYTATYSKGCKNVGTYTVTVKFRNNCSDTAKCTFKILPKKTAIKSVKADTEQLTIKWKKVKKQVNGYQIMYSTNKKFKGAKKVKVKKSGTTSKTIKKLKAKKKYYVKVRTYKIVKGKTYYSVWSKAKAKKTK